MGLIQCAFLQKIDQKLDETHLYLDTCATFSQVISEAHLSDVQRSQTGLLAYCNTCTTIMHMFKFLGKIKVWVNPEGLANILSFHELEQLHQIKYDTTTTRGSFDGHIKIVFKKNSIDLPYSTISDALKSLCFINTVQENCEEHTKKEILQAKKAREALAKVGHSTKREIAKLVRYNMIKNCPITHQDIVNANKIFSLNLPVIRGKTTRTKPMPVKTNYVVVPKYLITKNRAVCLTVDVKYVDGVPFLVTASRGIKFITIKHIPTETTSNLKQSLIQTIHCMAEQVSKSKPYLWIGSLTPKTIPFKQCSEHHSNNV